MYKIENIKDMPITLQHFQNTKQVVESFEK